MAIEPATGPVESLETLVVEPAEKNEIVSGQSCKTPDEVPSEDIEQIEVPTVDLVQTVVPDAPYVAEEPEIAEEVAAEKIKDAVQDDGPGDLIDAALEEDAGNDADANATNTESSGSSSSSSSSSSSESSDDSGDECDGRVQLDDAAGDDEVPRTKNEAADEPIPVLPAGFEMTESTTIEAIGIVYKVGDRTIVIQASSSGEYHVLAEGTVFCLEDKRVIGMLYDTFGPVEAPFYVVKFASESEIAPFVGCEGSRACYVVPASNFLLTSQFRTKGSDASNIHDEEVPEDEQEFSDDEMELLAKRTKRKKRSRKQTSTYTEAPSGSPWLPQSPRPQSNFVYTQPSAGPFRITPQAQLQAQAQAQAQAHAAQSQAALWYQQQYAQIYGFHPQSSGLPYQHPPQNPQFANRPAPRSQNSENHTWPCSNPPY